MSGLFQYFTQGTEHTKTGATIGCEIETHLVNENGHPISVEVTRKLLALTPPGQMVVTNDLGRQLIELAICPHESPESLMESTYIGLAWLYREAARFGARPLFQPILNSNDDLLYIADARDQIWVDLDGKPALEQICRVASIQFTVSVSPNDAIGAINRLWTSGLHELDYPNSEHWQAYFGLTRSKYDLNRFAGPDHFTDLEDYITQLSKQPVIMLNGKACQLPVESIAGDHESIDLFLRSVWWHYRLRRYGNSLCIEARPFARRDDASIANIWGQIAKVIEI